MTPGLGSLLSCVMPIFSLSIYSPFPSPFSLQKLEWLEMLAKRRLSVREGKINMYNDFCVIEKRMNKVLFYLYKYVFF